LRKNYRNRNYRLIRCNIIKSWKNKSILLIHGKKDIDNPYDGSEVLYAKLSGNKKVWFKTYSNLDHHTITIPLLLNEEIPHWLFK
jgi:dipeptidyl aminopeptidase/acylaminoacyl peptidase